MKLDNRDLINRKELIRYLGYGKQQPDQELLLELAQCEEKLVQEMEPAFLYKVVELTWDEAHIEAGGGKLILKGESIRTHLAGCNQAVLSCATLGKAVDNLIDEAQKEDMLRALLLDASANAAIEGLRLFMEQEISLELPDYEINWQFGVGYGDLPLSLQPELLNLLEAKEKIGLTANSRYLLMPLKSVSGIIGLRKKGSSEVADSCIQRGCASCDKVKTCMFQNQ